MYPTLLAYGEIEAEKMASIIINRCISRNEIMELDVDSLFLISRDTNGKIIPDSVIKFDLRTELGIMNDLKDQGKPVLLNEIIVRVAYFIRRLITEFNTTKIEPLRDFIY